ncbi:MAG: hypothetical protein EOP09_20430, partial [Proteobacteria bacterium]
MDNTSYELCETFVAESLDYIDELEPQFIELNQALACSDQVAFQNLMNHIFRLIHTIKGSAGSLGFKNIATLAHKAENLLDSIRHHKIGLTPHRLNLLTGSLDIFRTLMAILQQKQTDEGTEHLITELAAELDLANSDDKTPKAPKPAEPKVEAFFGVFDDEEEKAPTPVAVKFAINPVMRTAFVQEAEENFSKVELCLIGLSEQAPADRAKNVEESLRILHSVKGNAGFMQLLDMET